MTFRDILYSTAEGVATVTLHRPEKLNAFRFETLEEMAEAFADAEADTGVGVVVLTGSGDRAFCVGGDISTMADLTPAVGRKWLHLCLRVSTAIRVCSKPVIAAVNGYCLGGGHELHLLCDLTLAADHARFGQVGPKVGSAPIWGGTQMLPRIVGEKKAREMIFLCRQYSAQEALEMGLVNKVVPKEELARETREWCAAILEMSPQALKISKTSLNFESDLASASFLHGAEMLSLTYGSPEFMEGLNSFLEKRKANFAPFRPPRRS